MRKKKKVQRPAVLGNYCVFTPQIEPCIRDTLIQTLYVVGTNGFGADSHRKCREVWQNVSLILVL